MNIEVWPPIDERRRELGIRGDPVWYGFGTHLIVDGDIIDSPLVYVSERDLTYHEPSAIPLGDDSARVPPYPGGANQNWIPSITFASPDELRRYFTWLRGGRTGTHANVGLLRLYLSGLERHFCNTRTVSPEMIEERRLVEPVIRHLITQFRTLPVHLVRQAEALLAFLTGGRSLLDETHRRVVSDRYSLHSDVALSRIAIGYCAANKLAIPVDWALAWAIDVAWNRPSMIAVRCFDEFEELFALEFAKTYPKGFTVRPHPAAHQVSFSGSIDGSWAPIPGTADVWDYTVPYRALRTIALRATSELGNFNRFRMANPEIGPESIAYLAALPRQLQFARTSQVARALRPLRARIANEHCQIISNRELLDLVVGKDGSPDYLKPKALANLIDFLDDGGIGVELHPEASVQKAEDGHVAIFHCEPLLDGAVNVPVRLIRALIALGEHIASKTGGLTNRQRSALTSELARGLGLSPTATIRLEACSAITAKAPVKVTTVRRLLEPIREEIQSVAVPMLLAIAVADGVPGPGQMDQLERGYAQIGRDPDLAAVDLHNTLADGVARRPVQATLSHRKIDLDRAAIRRTIRESDLAAAQIAAVAEESEPVPQWQTPVAADPVSQAGLDPIHRDLLRKLAIRPNWTISEIRSVCRELSLMTNGAIDTLNEAAIETNDEPVILGSGPFVINLELLAAMGL